MTVYLDCNATTPVEPAVAAELLRFTVEEYGNAGSRTHDYGARAKRRVGKAREQVAAVVDADPGEVIFTSGATEANNLALLGLEAHGKETARTHIVSTAIEHKAVLEPLERLEAVGFEVDLVPCSETGWVDPSAVADRVRYDTLLVSVMHVNNETGVVQPIAEVADALAEHDAFLHVDAAQGFGKELDALRHHRIDLLSISAHKIYGPKGVGALIARRRAGKRPPLAPLMFGGGQELGLRPGTLPVGLIAALGTAAQLALDDSSARRNAVEAYRAEAMAALDELGVSPNGDPARTLPTTLNISLPGLDAEAAMVALKGVAAISNGSACTSQSYTPSHVLEGMGLDEDRIASALRISWSHLTEPVEWDRITAALGTLLPVAAPTRR